MTNRAEHTYTQLLVICVLLYVIKDASWWTPFAIVVGCSTLAIAVGVLEKKFKGE